MASPKASGARPTKPFSPRFWRAVSSNPPLISTTPPKPATSAPPLKRSAPIGPYDLLIAAQARRRGAALVTLNRREFERVPGLMVTDWAG